MIENLSVEALQKATLAGLSLMRDEVANLIDRHLYDESLASGTLRALFWYQSERSQSVSFLTSWQRIWDAEIIMRSFYEVSAKILLICFSPAAERETLLQEFWISLANIDGRRRSRNANFAKAVFAENDLSHSVFSLLQNDRLYDLSNKFSKAQRRDIERRWSFSEIIESLSRMAPSGLPLTAIKSFLHIYGTASHLLHADGAALDLMADRTLRDARELAILEISHVSRIWSDQFAIARFCAHALAHYIGCPPINGQRIIDADNELANLRAPFKDAFDDSQRDFYSGFQSKT